MSSRWQQRSLAARLAGWYAGVGTVVLSVVFLAALVTGLWKPADDSQLWLSVGIGIIGAATVFAVAGWFIAKRVLTPAKEMAEQARRLTVESLKERLPIANPEDELGQLAAVFNDTLQRLDDSFAELRRFTADASHELRTPLTAMRTVGEVALREGNPAILYDAVSSMLEEIGRVNQLIDRLLLLARAEGDQTPAKLAVAPIRSVLSEVGETLCLVADEKKQQLNVDCARDVTALIDPALLRLALMNLAQNAIRYSPQERQIQMRAFSQNGNAVIEVIDQGPGIATKHHQKIFERFYRVDKSRSRAEGGVGLGLAIVKWAVEKMDGTVEVQSEIGHGSIFRIRLAAESAVAKSESKAFADSVEGDDFLPAKNQRASGGYHLSADELEAMSGESLPEPFSNLHEAARGNTSQILERMKSMPDGISWREAARRKHAFGLNEVASQRPPTWPVVLWHSCKNPFNGVLLMLGVVSALTHDFKAATVMAVMITVSTVLRFWQEMKSLIQAESLRKMVRNKVTVLRRENETVERETNSLDQNASEILLEELVPGDIVKLSAGDMIPGDLRLLESKDVFVTQSALTGEAMPVEKYAESRRSNGNGSVPDANILDASNLCFMGSSIVSGAGKAIVLATGNHTFFGAMATNLVGQRPPTAFDRGVNKVSWLLIKFMAVMVPVVFLVNGAIKGNWLEAFFFAIAVAVGLTPEMLPMIVNANLARGAVAMSRKKVIVKRLSAIQNFGAMDVLCTDKTGTLTRDEVMLIEHLDMHGQTSERVLLHAYLNSLFQTGLKNLIDRAIIERANERGLEDSAQSFWKIDEIPFDFNRRRMSVVLQQSSEVRLLICKGAIEEMLAICSQVEDGERTVPLTDESRKKLTALRDELNADGLRVVAVGFKAITPGTQSFGVQDEHDLIFSGYVAFLDPPKETAAEALRLLAEHGIAVKILTGDNLTVARKVCRDVGLSVERAVVGTEIEGLSDEALADLAESTTIFAKLSPVQKARVVRVLKSRGHTVGFMGDGINDATALREADVGISVESGVDLAKESADIILLEKSLLVLERGVVEGRRTFGNIIKYIKMTASSNFGNVFSVLVASAFLPFLPMLAIQLLVQNLLYDFSQISIPWDRMDDEFVKKPRQWDARSIATFMIFIGPISSIFDVTTFLVLWFVFRANTEAREALFQSGWFVEGLLTQTLIVHMIRTEKVPFLQSTASLPVVLLTSAIMAIGVWLPFSPLATALRFQALPWSYFPWLAATLLGYCLLTQFLKKFYIRRFKSWL